MKANSLIKWILYVIWLTIPLWLFGWFFVFGSTINRIINIIKFAPLIYINCLTIAWFMGYPWLIATIIIFHCISHYKEPKPVKSETKWIPYIIWITSPVWVLILCSMISPGLPITFLNFMTFPMSIPWLITTIVFSWYVFRKPRPIQKPSRGESNG